MLSDLLSRALVAVLDHMKFEVSLEPSVPPRLNPSVWKIWLLLTPRQSGNDGEYAGG